MNELEIRPFSRTEKEYADKYKMCVDIKDEMSFTVHGRLRHYSFEQICYDDGFKGITDVFKLAMILGYYPQTLEIPTVSNRNVKEKASSRYWLTHLSLKQLSLTL